MKNNIYALLDQLNLIDNTQMGISELVGGKQHQTYLVIQGDKKWVVKQLHLDCWLGTYPVDYFEQVEKLAQQVDIALGNTISAVSHQNKVVHTIDNRFYLVMPWVEGEIASIINSQQSFELGKVLAQIHHLNLSSQVFKSFEPIEDFTQSVSTNYRDLLNQCNQSLHYRQSDFVLSHRDVNLSNVIWLTNNKPILIDWESAGYIHPIVELVGLALNCAGIEMGEINWHKFEATIYGYKSILACDLLNSTLYKQLYYTWFAWINYCLKQRSDSNLNHVQEINVCYQAVDLLQYNEDKIVSIINKN